MSSLKTRKQDAKEEAANLALEWLKKNMATLKGMLSTWKPAPVTAGCPTSKVGWMLGSSQDLVYVIQQHIKKVLVKPKRRASHLVSFSANSRKGGNTPPEHFKKTIERYWSCATEVKVPGEYQLRSFSVFAAPSMTEVALPPPPTALTPEQFVCIFSCSVLLSLLHPGPNASC